MVNQLQSAQHKMQLAYILRQAPYWEDIFKEIGQAIPSNSYLTSLTMEDNTLNLKGIITQGHEAAETTVARFMLQLKQGLLKNVGLITIKKSTKDPTVSEFEIKCQPD